VAVGKNADFHYGSALIGGIGVGTALPGFKRETRPASKRRDYTGFVALNQEKKPPKQGKFVLGTEKTDSPQRTRRTQRKSMRVFLCVLRVLCGEKGFVFTPVGISPPKYLIVFIVYSARIRA
jgi:hypothetical protein